MKLEKYINNGSNLQDRKSIQNKNSSDIMKSSFPSYEFKSNNVNYSIDDYYNPSSYIPLKNEIIIENPEEVIQSGCLKGSTIQNIPEIDDENNENNNLNNNNANKNILKSQNIYEDLNEDIVNKFEGVQSTIRQNNGQMPQNFNEIGDTAQQEEDINNQMEEMKDNQENINILPGKLTETVNAKEDLAVNEVENPDMIEKNIEPVEEVQETQNKKYQIITDNNSVVILPPNYGTDDDDEFNAVQTLNDDLSSWKKCTDKDGMKIYSKPFKFKNEEGKDIESAVLYLDLTLDFPASKVIDLVDDFNRRASFDGQYEKGKLISEKMIEGNIKVMECYLYAKMPFIFSDRDFVVQRKSWLDYNGNKDHALFFIHSIENSEFPAKEKPVRGEYVKRCGYIKPLGDNQCKIYIYNCLDAKLDIGYSVTSKTGVEKQEDWVKKLKKKLQ
jgi:hypothetical protein